MDVNVQAFRLVRDVTGDTPTPKQRELKAALREGGAKGARIRAMKLSTERRAEIAKAANEARWSKANVA